MRAIKYIIGIFFILMFLDTAYSQNSVHNDSIYIIQDSVLIPTRSGIHLSAIVVRKKVNTLPLPAILFYTTYYRDSSDAIFGKKSADKDYVGVVVYARGIKTDLRYYVPYEHEGTDIYDIINWISQQSWCNGKVGMYGGSYTGYSQWATAKKLHPALKTIVPQAAAMPGFDFPMENNVQPSWILNWTHDAIYKKEPIKSSLPFEWYQSGIAFSKMDSLAGYKNELFQNFLKHPSYDNYWQSMVPTAEEYGRINIPILSTTGYYDGGQISTLQYYKLHNKYNPTTNHYFVIGPYDHWGGQRSPAKNLMGYEIDSVANISMGKLAYEWLDYILKGKPKPEILKDKFNYEVMGANEWKHAPSMQKINNDTLTLYLDHKVLMNYKPKVIEFERQEVDFKDRVNQNNNFSPLIILDSLDTSNGILYKTEIFENEFSINGSFCGNLFASINKKDMDVSIVLYEQMPNGKYFYLTRYLGRASYAKDNTKRQLLKPNTKQSIPFGTTRFISKKIAKGSRLVISLNINKHPFEIINYGTGKPVANDTIKDAEEPLRIKWYNDSYIKVPIFKN